MKKPAKSKELCAQSKAESRAINTTAEHPYFVKPDSLPNKISKASEGAITLSDIDSFNPLSPDSILQPNLRDKATYGTSFRCGAIDTAFFALSSNALNGIISTDLLMNLSTSKISPLGSFDSEAILSRLLESSEYIYCVEINSNLPNISFSSKTKRDLPLVTSAENTTLKSMTSIIFYDTFLSSEYFTRAESRNLLDTDKLTSSASSFACFSVNLDFDTIDSILFISDNFSLNSSFKNLENNNCHIFSGISLPSTVSNSLLTSSGTLNNNSSTLASPKDNYENNYLKLSDKWHGEWIEVKDLKENNELLRNPNNLPISYFPYDVPAPTSNELSTWIEVNDLSVGDEIAVPDYSSNTIKSEKIAAITALEPQHTYDLSIEGTRNFIANNIVAHNTYLATSSGSVGIGTINPASTLEVAGTANLTQGTTSFRVTSDNNIIIHLE